MSSTHTLEELLNLALGTPEIGAVNFNYLYDLILEVLKHLGISRKLAGATEEIDFRSQLLSGRSTAFTEVQQEYGRHSPEVQGDANAVRTDTELWKTEINAEGKPKEFSPDVSQGAAAENGRLEGEKANGQSKGQTASQEKSRKASGKNARENVSKNDGMSSKYVSSNKSSAIGKRNGGDASGSVKVASQKDETLEASSKIEKSKSISPENSKTPDGKLSSTKGGEIEADFTSISPENSKTPDGKLSSTKGGEIEADFKSVSPENSKTPDGKLSSTKGGEIEADFTSISPENSKTSDGKLSSTKGGGIEADFKSVSPENSKTSDGKLSSTKGGEIEAYSKSVSPENGKSPDGKLFPAKGGEIEADTKSVSPENGKSSDRKVSSTKGGEIEADSKSISPKNGKSPDGKLSSTKGGEIEASSKEDGSKSISPTNGKSPDRKPSSTRREASSGPEITGGRASTRGGESSRPESTGGRASTRGGASSGPESTGGRASTRGGANSGSESIGGRASPRGGASSGPESPILLHVSRRDSSLSAGFSDRRLSLLSGPNDGSIANNQDIALVNRSLQNKESKTPAGDMWHILNINRRLEAIEVAIEGITGIVDGISSDVEELQDATKRFDYMKGLPALPNEISNIDEQLKNNAKNEQIEHFFSASTVETLSDEEPSSRPVSAKSSVEQPPKRKESRIKVLQDVLIRIIKLEEYNKFTKEDLGNVKQALPSKVAISDFDFTNKKIELLEKELSNLKLTFSVVDFMQEDLARVCIESDTLKKNTNQVSQEQEEININMAKLGKELKSLTDKLSGRMDSNVSLSSDSRTDNFAVLRLKTVVSDIQEQHRLLEGEVRRIDIDKNANTDHLQLVDKTLEEIKETKVDKETNEKQLDKKADKTQLEEKVSQNQFDTCLGHFDRNLQDMMQRVDGQETIIRQCLTQVESTLERKASLSDLNRLNDTFDHRFKTIKLPPPEVEKADEGAAGFRRPLLRDFNCISCSHPLEIHPEDAITSLPNGEALPGSKAIRPYTTFELEQIRRQIRGAGCKDKFEMGIQREKLQKQLLRLCGANDLDDLAARTTRQCGGTHTVLDPQKRAMVKTALLYRDDTLQIRASPEPMMEGEVLGRDGQIYRGRQDALPPLHRLTRHFKAISERKGIFSSNKSKQTKPQKKPKPVWLPVLLCTRRGF